jgi:hypothetical protein
MRKTLILFVKSNDYPIYFRKKIPVVVLETNEEGERFKRAELL